MPRRSRTAILLALAGTCVSACTTGRATPHVYPGLENVVVYHEGFHSGGVPRGEAGFESLSGLGIRTIISVDGAVPDLDRADASTCRSDTTVSTSSAGSSSPARRATRSGSAWPDDARLVYVGLTGTSR